MARKYNPVAIALGANLPGHMDSPQAEIAAAVAEIRKSDLEVMQVSRFWRTPAVPQGSGPDFVNAALLARSDVAAQGILALLHDIELRAGRVRRRRWGARVLDLDLLAVGDLILPDIDTFRQWQGLDPAAQQQRAPDGLVLPHPRLQDRAFVLAPLREIAPDWRHPVLQLSVAEMHDALPARAFAGMVPI